MIYKDRIEKHKVPACFEGTLEDRECHKKDCNIRVTCGFYKFKAKRKLKAPKLKPLILRM